MNQLEKVVNIGPVNAEKLVQVGINNIEDLKKAGAENAFLRIRTIDPGACLHLLYGLEGAVQGIKKSHISTLRKKELQDFFKHCK